MKKITIEDKISFIEKLTKRFDIANDNLNVSIWCPFCKHHNRNKLKLVIHLEKGFYHCWLCDKKGSNIPGIVKLYNRNLVEESKKLFKKRIKSDLFFSFDNNNDILIEEEIQTVSLPEDFRLLANAFNSSNPDVRDIFKYCIKRGVNKHKMWMLKLGYSLENDFRRSLIIPSFDHLGKVNYYTSRMIDVDSNNPFKYKNASISKKNIIFNEVNINWNLPLTIVEGPLDLIKVNDNSTCLLGSSLTSDMKLFELIVKNKTTVNLALDKDAYYKAVKIANLLYQYDIDVNILDTRIADDVGDMTKEQFLECLENAKLFSKEDNLLNKISMI